MCAWECRSRCACACACERTVSRRSLRFTCCRGADAHSTACAGLGRIPAPPTPPKPRASELNLHCAVAPDLVAYAALCCAALVQLDTSAAALLPHLNSDDIQAAAVNGPKQQQPQQAQRRGGMRVSRTGSAGPAPGETAAAAAAALAAAAAGEGKAAGGSVPRFSAALPTLEHHGGVAQLPRRPGSITAQ